ncbi:hypothetical protein [Methylobacterium adhaesivum]|uniref:Uncharacterized protein n=1 Tax=Methylobacterium adhaesivum TaxID=333297 RepID=A0ABT8BHU8_9HYPH|nr:hypothetical protein [Methylobacterium adhaesivum]MDN3590871.1 hypothetical protein [Methylobacterium adhaesivum]
MTITAPRTVKQRIRPFGFQEQPDRCHHGDAAAERQRRGEIEGPIGPGAQGDPHRDGLDGNQHGEAQEPGELPVRVLQIIDRRDDDREQREKHDLDDDMPPAGGTLDLAKIRLQGRVEKAHPMPGALEFSRTNLPEIHRRPVRHKKYFSCR